MGNPFASSGTSSKSSTSGGSNPFSGGSSKKATGSSGGLAAELGSMAAEVKKAGQNGVGDAAAKIADTSKHGFSAIASALSALDYPRSIIVSGLHQAATLNNPDSGGPSWHNFLQDVQQHKGVGQYLHDNGGTGNIWGDRVLGFVGDVGLDPLTYLSFGANTAVETGGRKTVSLAEEAVARRILEPQNVEKFGKQAAEQMANDVLKKGVSTLPKDATAQLGIKTGAHIGVGSYKFLIPHSEDLAAALNKVTYPARAFATDNPLSTFLREKIATHPELVALKKTDELGHLKAFKFEEAARTAVGQGRGTTDMLRRQLADLADQHGHVDQHALLARLEGATTGLDGKPFGSEVDAAAKDLRSWYDGAKQHMQDVTGRTIGDRADYQPWQMSRDLKELEASRAAGTGGKIPFEMRKTLMDPEAMFLGETLTGGAAERRAQIEAIARRNFGDNYRKVLEDNPWKLAQGYANGAGRFVQKHLLNKGIADRGLEADLKSLATQVPSRVGLREQAKLQKAASDILDQVNQRDAQAATDVAAPAVDRTVADVAAPQAATDGIVPSAPAPTGASTDVAAQAQQLVAERQQLSQELAKAQADHSVAKATRATEEAAALQSDRAAASADQALQAAKDRLAHLTNPKNVSPLSPNFEAQMSERIALQKQIPALEQATKGAAASPAALTQVAPHEVKVAEAQAKLADNEQKLRALMGQSKDAVTTAPPVEPKVQVAAKVVGSEGLKFDTAAAAVRGGQMEASDNSARLAALELRAQAGNVSEGQATELAARRQAADLYAQAAQHTDSPALAQVARTEALAAQTSADMAAAGTLTEQADRTVITRMQSQREVIRSMGERSLTQYADGHWAEPWVAEAVNDLHKLTQPDVMPKLVRIYDWITARWKSYSLLTPGFHPRNLMGAMFNNSFRDVEMKSYRDMFDALVAFHRGGIEAVSEDVRPAFKAMMDNNVLWGSARDLADVLPSEGLRRDGLLPERFSKIDPTSLNNVALAANHHFGEAVHNLPRGALFLDTYRKTGRIPEAIDAVIKYHFDYADLSKLEKTYLKRIIPFYTFTRKNFPLQIENMLRDPGMFTRYLHAKRNLELGTPSDGIVPDYYASLLAIRTPFKSKGSNVYFTPDLPFRDLAETFDTNKLLASINPIIKTPLEVVAGKQLYSNIPISNRMTDVPNAFKVFLPVLIAMHGKFGMPKVTRAKDGTWVMSEKDAYKIDQTMPLLAHLRRLAPNEKKYQDRALTSYLSIVGGLSSQTNNDSAKYGEIARRVKELQDLNAHAKQLSN